jgi:hypothetical protein
MQNQEIDEPTYEEIENLEKEVKEALLSLPYDFNTFVSDEFFQKIECNGVECSFSDVISKAFIKCPREYVPDLNNKSTFDFKKDVMKVDRFVNTVHRKCYDRMKISDENGIRPSRFMETCKDEQKKQKLYQFTKYLELLRDILYMHFKLLLWDDLLPSNKSKYFREAAIELTKTEASINLFLEKKLCINLNGELFPIVE